MASILVVDDEADARAALRTVLEDQGHTVIGAQNGKRALHYLTSDETPPDLILLDLSMPELSGWELASILARYTRLAGIPIIVVSALTDHLYKLRDQIAGALNKPVDAGLLMKAVSEQLQRLEAKRGAMPADRF